MLRVEAVVTGAEIGEACREVARFVAARRKQPHARHALQDEQGEKEDEAPIRLEEGVNRILVKITNAVHGWGFGVAVPKPNF